jgi:hypothetical protein
MKAKELRLGNLVNSVLTNETQIIDLLSLRVIDEGNFQKFEPISLNEEWLIKFGFKKRNDRLFTLNYFEIHMVNGLFYFESYKLIPLNFIHQLQNTYFISEGIELELSSNVA